MSPAAAFLSGFLLAFLAAGAALYGLYRHSRRTRPGSQAIKGYLDLIPDLTPDQRARVQEIRTTFLPRVNQIRSDLRRERAELAALLFADPPVVDDIQAVARRILLRQSDLENEVITHILQEQDLLTPPQKQRFHEIIVEQFSTGGLGVHDVRSGKG